MKANETVEIIAAALSAMQLGMTAIVIQDKSAAEINDHSKFGMPLKKYVSALEC